MTNGQSAENRNADPAETIAEDIDDRPSTCLLERGELPDGHASDATQVSRIDQPRQMTIDVPEALFDVLDQKDGSVQIRQCPARRAGDRVEISAQQDAFRGPMSRQLDRHFM